MINDPKASLMYVECHAHLPPLFADVKKMMTDFFAFKPSALPNKRLPIVHLNDAEASFTHQMLPIIIDRGHRHIPDAFPMMKGQCRINGNIDGPVVHFHDGYDWIPTVVDGNCPANFH